jgi:tripeptidyl-peptidase-1
MSIQGSAIATFENLTQKDTSSFVILPALLPSTPQLLARLYNAPMQYTCLDNRTSFAIFSSSEVVKQDDLDAYGKWMGLTLGSMNFDNLPFEKCPNCERGEATLDVEIMLGMVKGATMWHWNFDKDGMFFYLANALLNNLTGTPDVISISYGSDEAGPVSNLLNIVNDMYAILATTAKTIMTASGDNGVYGNGCKCNIGGVPFTDKSQCSLCCGRTLSFPEWPATCPYITVVGGTAAVVAGSTPFYQNPSAAQNTNSHYHIHEIMAGSESGGVITSGGGYSSMFPARPFMQKAMLGYLKQHSSNTNLSEAIITQSSVMWPAFNSSGTLMRGYPDVSALAARIPIFLSQAPSQRLFTGGTSASTPLFASYVVMMNDLRLQAGLPKLGNILPLLYMLGDKHPDVYNDVTVGYHGVAVVKNSGCGGVCPDALDCIIGGQRQGLTAAPGWDAVTGFGSINFERIIRYVVPGNDIVSIASLMKTRSVVAENAAAAAAAATSASNASTSASNAATSASNAATSASDAATLASAAATAASAAAVSARSIASSVLINVTAALINVTAAASAAASSAVESTSTVAFNASKQADLSRNIASIPLFPFLLFDLNRIGHFRAHNAHGFIHRVTANHWNRL